MIVEIIIILLAIPAGLMLAHAARDELEEGRNWFRILTIASLALAGLFWLLGYNYITLTLIFIAIVSFISYIKSKDRKFIRKR